jgi:multisubunit Na+/H+ antiporter MnhF subunit
MAGLAPWLIATIGLLPALGFAVFECCVGPPSRRLVAAQLASAFGAIVLVAMSVAFDQASSIDLALMLGLLTIPQSLLFALFVERWL